MFLIDLAFVAAIGLGAFLVAWIVNALVGIMSGENPRDTGRLGFEIFLRLFAVLELGIVGRVLNYLGLSGWSRKLTLSVGLLCVLAFLFKACQHTQARDDWSKTYGITNGHLFEIKKP